jgi:ribosomal protein S18 acetylase RimI-like enzyme
VAVGYLLCTFVYSFEHGGLMAEIDELFVGAAYRQQGIGRALLARARTALAACGCLWLQMQVADDNARRKSGYRLWVAPLNCSAPWQATDTKS